MSSTAQPQPLPLMRLRLATLLFPPLGLLLLWLAPASILRKLFGTLFIGFYSLLYAALIVAALVKFAGLQIEWRGGFGPSLTWNKTVPDYDAVEASRAQQAKAATTPAARSTSTYWADFRGPKRDGHYQEQSINTNWTGGLKELWRQPVGGGYASFVVANGLAFTIEQRRNDEAITAYDLETGREVWAHKYPAMFAESMGGDGPRATPTWHDGKLYSLGAVGHLICCDAATGKVLWQRNVLDDSRSANLMYALSGSPLVVDEKLIVLAGDPGATGHGVVAYHKDTGEVLWKAFQEKQAYLSPMLVELAGERQIVFASAFNAVGLSPADGKELWRFPHSVQYDNNIAQPIVFGPDKLLLSAGYGKGATALQIGRTADGFAATQLWHNKFLKNKFASSVLLDGHVYGLDEDILTCLEAETGRRQWKDGRYGYGQLLLASGHLVILCGDGALALVKATPEQHIELARFPAIKGKTWNHPAIADGKLLIRNSVEMACYDLSAADAQR
ncbi:MAG: PQQ-binding-like beta-propeller repeat protein [Verrucomicrobiota bacterium]